MYLHQRRCMQVSHFHYSHTVLPVSPTSTICCKYSVSAACQNKRSADLRVKLDFKIFSFGSPICKDAHICKNYQRQKSLWSLLFTVDIHNLQYYQFVSVRSYPTYFTEETIPQLEFSHFIQTVIISHIVSEFFLGRTRLSQSILKITITSGYFVAQNQIKLVWFDLNILYTWERLLT